MSSNRPTLLETVVKTIVSHSVTYFIVGLVAFNFFDYAHLYADTSLNLLMRQTDSPWVMAGPALQPIRGALFGLIFYLLRETFFAKKNGWLVMWATLVVLGILGTFGPTPGSLEGVFFTILPLWVHLTGLPEVLLQSFLLAALLYYWINHPGRKWLNWLLGIVFFIVTALPLLGLLVTQPG